MPAPNSMHRAALVAAATAGGVVVAIIVDIVLARRGIGLVGAWQGVVRSGGTPLRAAVAWWVMAVAAFLAGLIIAMLAARFSWLYLRSLRWVAVCALTGALAIAADLAPTGEAATAVSHALLTLAALAVAMVMAGFGAFFAVGRQHTGAKRPST